MILYQFPGLAKTVYHGLAAENLLTQRSEGAEPVLFIWTGPEAVVMGKNQNPWREVNLEALQEHGLPLARRSSGGGTVYHDPGNLNVSWILPRDDYDATQLQRIWTRTLQDFGLEPQPGVSGGLRVRGKKVSGAAFCYRRHHVLHHGTLLLSANIPRMRQLLSPRHLRMTTHAVDSIPAAVANLQDFHPTLDVTQVTEALKRNAVDEFGPLREYPDILPSSEMQKEAQFLQSTEWIWDQTPTFKVEAGPFRFQVRKGIATDWSKHSEPSTVPSLPFRTSSLPKWAEHMEMELPEFLKNLETHGWKVPD